MNVADVFISYSSTDSAKAVEALNLFEYAGISCWFAQRDILPGANYAVEIPRAIKNCSHFVLLLSNEAQESPFVKLELDQAIKHRKTIMPVLLEKIHETEDTNFFLNAKQSVDGTKNFSLAINTVIHGIRTNSVMSPIIPNQPQNSDATKRLDYIRCPYCGGTVLKQKQLFIDRYLYQKDNFPENEAAAVWLLRNNHMVNAAIAVISLLAAFSMFFITFSGTFENGMIFFLLLICTGLFFLLMWIKFQVTSVPEIAETLIRTINTSGLKCYSFRCAGCEELFSVLRPKKIPLKDQVEVLVSEKHSQNDKSQEQCESVASGNRKA